MTAPAPITQSTSDLLREMRKEQAPSIVGALRQCRDALDHHQDQTRPIYRTAKALAAADAALAALSEPQDERAAFERWYSTLAEAPWYPGIQRAIAWNAWQARASHAPTPQPEPLVGMLRSRGCDLTSHPVANGSIGCTEEAGELLIRAADALEAALATATSCCAECGKKDGDGWALYCVDCISSKIAPAIAPASQLQHVSPADELPDSARGEVPMPKPLSWSDLSIAEGPAYSLAQLRAYGDARALAERERCAKVCEDIADEYQRTEGMKYPELKSDAQTGASDCMYRITAQAQQEGK